MLVFGAFSLSLFLSIYIPMYFYFSLSLFDISGAKCCDTTMDNYEMVCVNASFDLTIKGRTKLGCGSLGIKKFRCRRPPQPPLSFQLFKHGKSRPDVEGSSRRPKNRSKASTRRANHPSTYRHHRIHHSAYPWSGRMLQRCCERMEEPGPTWGPSKIIQSG